MKIQKKIMNIKIMKIRKMPIKMMMKTKMKMMINQNILKKNLEKN